MMVFVGTMCVSYNVKRSQRVKNCAIEDCTKDGGEELFTEMHCARITIL